MFDKIKGITDILKNDKTRVVIRLFCIILIASQIFSLANIQYNGYIPLELLEVANLLSIPAIYFFSLIIVVLISGILGILYRLVKGKDKDIHTITKKFEYLLASILSVSVMFVSIYHSRIFAILGLILFIIFDLVLEYKFDKIKEKQKKQKISNSI